MATDKKIVCSTPVSGVVSARYPILPEIGCPDEETVSASFESNPLPMWIFDQKTLAFLAVNNAAIENYGFSRQEFLSMTILDIRPLEDIPALLRSTLRPRPASSQPEAWRHCTKCGVTIEVEITSCQVVFKGRQAEVVVARPANGHHHPKEPGAVADFLQPKAGH